LKRGDMLPKHFFAGVYAKDRRLVEFRVVKKNVVGALAKITALLAELGVDLCSGFLSAYPGEARSVFSFVADLSGVGVSPAVVAERLRGLDVVLDVRYSEPTIPGFMVDVLHFPLLSLGERSVSFTVRVLGAIFKRLYEVYGSGGAFILYDMGVEAGRAKVEAVRSRYRLDGRDVLELILEERVAKGWCLPRLVEFNMNEARVEVDVYELFECGAFRGGAAQSSFFRGYLAGVLRTLFRKDVEVVEDMCVAKGDEYCRFKSGLKEV